MTPFTRLAVLALVACAHAQYSDERAPRYIASESKVSATTPVSILKQINSLLRKVEYNITTPAYPKRTSFFEHLKKVMHLIKKETIDPSWHNEDGSYTYGYEAGDGSFKIETKSPAGEVKGKYGYKDDTGKVRVIEYGANKFGFQPSGEGITVAPPTLVDETQEERQRQHKQQPQSRRNQYQPAPAQALDYDYNDEAPPAPPPRPAPRPQQQQYRPQQQQYRPQPAPQQQPPFHLQPAPQQRARELQQQSKHQFGVPPPTQAPQYRPSPQQSPTPPKPQFFSGAAPVPAQDDYFNPEPAPQRRTFQQNKQQAYRPPVQFPDFTDAAPSRKEFNPSDYVPQPPQRDQPYSMLDQLLKEYGLPTNGSPPLHDITFGSY